MDMCVIGIATLAVLIAITAVGIHFKSKLKHLYKYGYFGIFIGCLIGNITPGTTSLFTMVVGGRYYPLLMAAAAGAFGALLGELLIYNMGALGNTVMKDHDWFETAKQYIERFGFIVIVLITAIPTPLFNISAVVAGMLRYPVLLFLTAAFLGQWLKYFFYAIFGKVTKRIS
jgi:membrane protein YqaA with SNARE-associated domain